jgi:DnaJ-class molecular chaperone
LLQLTCEDHCTANDLRRARNAQALIWHPDKNHDDPQAAAARFREIQSAYERLSAKLEKQQATGASSTNEEQQQQQPKWSPRGGATQTQRPPPPPPQQQKSKAQKQSDRPKRA